MLRLSRIHPWTCSKFADWIRGEKKPYALEWHKWDEWKKDLQNRKPFRYWLSEKGLKKLENFVYFPADLYHTIDVYVRNRWIDKTHVLQTGLKPGQYYEFDYKVLHGLFYELTDYVEKELAGMQTWHNEKKYTFVKGRCVQAGLDYLEWASSLTYDECFLKKRISVEDNSPHKQSLHKKSANFMSGGQSLDQIDQKQVCWLNMMRWLGIVFLVGNFRPRKERVLIKFKR